MPIKTIKNLPSLGGVPDLIKSITFIPGVSAGLEGYSSIFVRGGDRGQNLILLDGIKIYNSSHVGGLLSLINSDIVKHVDVYKGGFPSRYGSRTSSVIDIYSIDGNSKELKGNAYLGVLTSGLMLEEPVTEKFNFFIAARASYYDLFGMEERKKYNMYLDEYLNNRDNTTLSSWTQANKIQFVDANAKFNWNISSKSKLSLALFTGYDHRINGYIGFYSSENFKEEAKLSITI